MVHGEGDEGEDEDEEESSLASSGYKTDRRIAQRRSSMPRNPCICCLFIRLKRLLNLVSSISDSSDDAAAAAEAACFFAKCSSSSSSFQSRFRFCTLGLRIASGRFRLCILLYRPHALQTACPFSFLRHNGVFVCKQLAHRGTSTGG